MFIRISRAFGVSLEEAEDFKHFKLVVETGRDALPALRQALADIANLPEEGIAWVAQDWLRRQSPAEAWQDGLTAMIAVAAKYGWVEAQTGAIRAHVEWPNDTAAKS